MLSDFKNILSSRFLFGLGSLIQVIVLGWHMYDLTKDPLYLGFIGLASAIPALGLALHAGLIVDKGRPLVIFRRVLWLNFVSALILIISQIPQFHFTTQHEVIVLFLSAFMTGVARAFQQPTIYAIVPRIIPRDLYSKYAAWMTTSMQGARILGPALGGLLFGYIGVMGSMLVVCFFLVIAIFQSYSIKKDLPPAHTRQDTKPLEDLLIGAKFVFRNKILLPAMSLDMISVFFGGVTALLPIYAADILMIGPKGLGFLRAAPAVGAILSSFALTRLDIRKKAGPWLFWAVTGFGVAILVFSVSQNYLLSLLALVVAGAFDSISMVVRTSAVQLSSPDTMRGRISAVNSMFIGSSNELGEFESGVAAKLLGTVPSAVFGGVVCLLTVVVTAVVAPTLRKMNLIELEAAGAGVQS